MKTAFEKLESPYLDGELEFVVPAKELSTKLAYALGESPFANFLDLRRAETGQLLYTGVESPELEVIPAVEAEVLDKDERTLVADTFMVPNRWICAIDILIDNPEWPKKGPKVISKSRATGILIGPRYVLTARHVGNRQPIEVGGKQKQVEVKGFTVSPARNGDNSKNPFGKMKSKAFLRSQHKSQTRQNEREVITQYDDYALIILEKDVSSGTHSKMNGELAYWGHLPAEAVIRRLEPDDLNGKEVVVIGYPGDRCGKDKIEGSSSEKKKKIAYCAQRRGDEWASTQWRSLGTVQLEGNSSALFHTADTYAGQSGAPICLSADGSLNLVGIHTDESGSQKNKGVRITRRMLREICSWMNDDAGHQIATIKEDTLIVQPQIKETKELDALEGLDEVEGEDGFETDESDSFAGAEEFDEDFGNETEDDLPGDEITELDAEDADEYEVEDGRLFEAFAPKVTQADLRTRIDDYLDRAKFEYTIPKRKLPDGTEVPESKVKAWPQFNFARMLLGETKSQKEQRLTSAATKVREILGSKFNKNHPKAIHNGAYGRPKPSEVAAITQGLINAGELNAVRQNNSSLTDEQLVRQLQREFAIGIDCAGYVQLAFIFAFLGHDNDTPKVRQSLKLKTRGNEVLNNLPSSHFKVVDFKDAQTGDLFVLKPRANDDGALHTVIIVDHTVSDDVHTFLADASWGTDLYGLEAGGVARRELKFNTKTKKWWDISPVDRNSVCGVDVKKGDKACENDVGPYNGHPIQGMYRAKHKK